jgi:hypothetical protein
LVNIKDVKGITGDDNVAQEYLRRGGGRLEGMFVRQTDLEEKYHPIEEKNVGHKLPTPFGNFEDIDDPATQRRLKEIAYRIVEELSEATNTLKNGKPWKSSHVKTDVDHFLEETVDALHFFIEFCLCAGINAHVLYELYMDKSRVNQFRQESNY